MSEPSTDEPSTDEGKRERILSHRFWAMVVGLPLVATFFVPWKVQRAELSFFEMADTMEHLGWALMPFVGVALLIATFAPMPPLARRALLAVSGVSALLLGSLLLRAEQTRWYLPDPYLAEGSTITLVVLSWIGAASFEMAMHARPRSRGISVAALLGWTLLLLSFAVPIGTRPEWESSLAGTVFKELDRHDRLKKEHLFILGYAFLALIAWLQALRRVGKDRTLAAARRFRTSWIVYILVPLPFLGVYGFMLVESLDRGDVLTRAHNPMAFVFASLFGGALGIANAATLLAGWKPPRWIRDATAAGFAGAGIFLAVQAMLPDARERRSLALVDAIGEATVLGLRGQTIPERFLGGYEEFDLRAAPAALEGHATPGAPLRLIASAVRYLADSRPDQVTGWAVSIDGNLRWTGNTALMGRLFDVEVLSHVDAALADLIGFAFDASADCLPALSTSERARIGDAFSQDSSAVFDETLCREARAAQSFFATAHPQLRGTIDRYRVIVELPSGEVMTFEGALLFDTRLWVGPPSAIAPVP